MSKYHRHRPSLRLTRLGTPGRFQVERWDLKARRWDIIGQVQLFDYHGETSVVVRTGRMTLGELNAVRLHFGILSGTSRKVYELR